MTFPLFHEADLQALQVTLQLAGLTTAILLLLGTPLAWWLARSRWQFKFLLEAVVALPLVLPPTVLGFYLLLFLGPHGAIGQLVNFLGGPPLPFSFAGLVVGSVVYSLPFVVQPLQNAFAQLGTHPLEAAATLRASPWDRFFSISLPMARSGFLTATVLGFAHSVGEFGVVLMIGGNIPNKTRVISIAIYDHVEAMNYTQAHLLSGSLLALSFVLLITVYGLNRHLFMIKSG